MLLGDRALEGCLGSCVLCVPRLSETAQTMELLVGAGRCRQVAIKEGCAEN